MIYEESRSPSDISNFDPPARSFHSSDLCPIRFQPATTLFVCNFHNFRANFTEDEQQLFFGLGTLGTPSHYSL